MGCTTSLCADGKKQASAEVIKIADDKNEAGSPGPTGGGTSRTGQPKSTNMDEVLARSLQQQARANPPLECNLGCTNVLYLSVCLLTLPVHNQESPGWADLSDDVCDRSVADMLASLSMDDSSASQAGVAGCRVYKETSATGKRIMDNLAAAYANVVFSELMTFAVIPAAAEVVLSEAAHTTVASTDVGTGMSSAEGVSKATSIP